MSRVTVSQLTKSNAPAPPEVPLNPQSPRALGPPIPGLPPVSVTSVLTLALPVIADQVLAAIIGLTDTIVAGHVPGDDQTVAASAAAVGVMTYLQWFAGLMTAALGVGATAIVARCIGAQKTRRANRAAGTAFSAAFLVGIAISTVMFIFADQIASLVGLRGLAHTYAVQYLQIMVITMSFSSAGGIGQACLRGAGDTVRPMLISAAVMVINLFASSSLTFGWFGLPALGVRGNALGTLFAFAVGGIATTFFLIQGNGKKLKLKPHHFRIVPHLLMRILRIGFPSWLEGALLWGGNFAVIVLVISRRDASGATLAAHNAVLRVESIAFLPGFGFGIAASTLVGQYLGARRPEEARHAAWIALKLAFWTMTILALPMVFAPRFMLSLLITSPSVIAAGTIPLILAGIAQPPFAYAIVFGSALKGAGETFWPMICTITGVFAVRVPLVFGILYLFSNNPWMTGLRAVWIVIIIDLTYRAIFNTLVFLGGKWRFKKV